MTQRSRSALTYLSFALIVLALVAASTLAPSYTECDEAYKGEIRDPEQGNPKPESHRTFTDQVMAFTDCEGEFIHKNEGVITAISTILIALFTLTLWRSTERLWEAGERQFLATFRPRLVVREVAWVKNGVSLTIENVGGNPCTIVESDLLLRGGDPDGRVLRTEGRNRIGKVTLRVGQFHDHIHGFDAGEESFTAGFSEPEEITSGAHRAGLLEAAFFMGTIVYEDPIKIRRRMTFLRISPAGSRRFVRTANPEDEYADQ